MLAVNALVPPPVLAIATREAVVLFDAAGKETERLPIAARRLEWSKDGRTLAILARDGRLSTYVPGETPQTVAEDAGDPTWTFDGRLLFVQGACDVAMWSPGGGSRVVVPKAHSPTPNPSGDRLFYATDGREGGVWSAAPDGSGATRLLKGDRVGGVSSSYDGRLVAAVVEGHLRTVRANGLEPRDLGPVGGGTARWSEGTADLLARRGRSWSVYDALKAQWTDVELDAVPEPRWSGVRTLLGVRRGEAVEITLGGRPKPVGDLRGIVDAARYVGVYRGAGFGDPFRDAPMPGAGSAAWRGKVVAFDPATGRIDLAVESEIDARRGETVFPNALARSAIVPQGPLARRLSVPPDTEAWIVVKDRTVLDAYLPDESRPMPMPEIAPALTPLAATRALRSARAVEYDGVTRERVVVPMVYPMPGRRKFEDTFLADRGGGTRRHHGNDLMAPKMTPLLAVFDGVVSFTRTTKGNAGNSLTLQGDDGFVASYLHINNDTPGTDDGKGSARYAFPADLQPGDRVRAGQVVAWCGDSGNAEDAGSHLHFELYDEDGRAILDPFFSLNAARILDVPLYPDPNPDLRAERDEVRWDGVVTSVDTAKNVVGLELTGIGAAGASPRAQPRPPARLPPDRPGLEVPFAGRGRPCRIDHVAPSGQPPLGGRKRIRPKDDRAKRLRCVGRLVACQATFDVPP